MEVTSHNKTIKDECSTAQCDDCTVQWPCGIGGYSRKNTFSWENNIFEAIFPVFF